MTATDPLVAMVAHAAAEVARQIEPPRFAPVLTYAEAGEAMGGLHPDSIAKLVRTGVLVRPRWAIEEVSTRVVTTVSVFAANDWPIAPVVVAGPAAAQAIPDEKAA